eukprot:1916241-Pyramimonas_sp.AAC.1
MGYSKKTLKRMARCYAMVRHEALRTHVRRALGATLEKKGDMVRTVGCAKGPPPPPAPAALTNANVPPPPPVGPPRDVESK